MESHQNNQSKLSVKDLVLVGVLGAVAGAVCMVIGLLCGMSPITNPLYPIIAAIPNGIVYMLMLAKVPKRGVFTVAGIVYSVLFLVMGTFWFVVLCFMVMSVVADAIMWGNPRSFRRMVAGYAATVAGLSFGYGGAIVLMRDTFNDVMVRNGIPAEYSEALNAFVSDPMLVVLTVAGILVAIAGAFVGRRILCKHFIRAGLVAESGR
ncbi:MAG TPA: MptD family putative ECF transporter S component [Candidatus Aveggerthella stercoripullorum]|uniref:MptD family putative ECF transporter S component n=1 Tax=Candidatus Aveggerthella stercoripullorum TaxID=2840688 RepID=A0A9D1A1B7_9ACTN|nr:MptD family putative ECF transporter S component [Candidatus Aveggerthella stercoripullorum]